MPAATLPAPEPPFFADRCGNCGRLVERLFKDRCKTCSEYRRKHKRERPAHLWDRKQVVAWKPVEPWLNAEGQVIGPWCECGGVAAWKLTVPISEKARTRLLLCEGCAALEKS
jgi:hypothetical protein